MAKSAVSASRSAEAEQLQAHVSRKPAGVRGPVGLVFSDKAIREGNLVDSAGVFYANNIRRRSGRREDQDC